MTLPRISLSDLLPTVLATAFCALGATAQVTQRVLPAQASLADGQESTAFPFGHDSFRTQILLDGPSVAANLAVITDLRFRVDRNSTPLATRAVPNVTIEMSHTSVPVGSLVSSFAGNVTGVPVTVFQGTVNLPAQTPFNAGPGPWNVQVTLQTPFQFVPAQGHLLIDIRANNAPGALPSYWLDAVEPGGTATQFGTAGMLGNGDSINFVAHTGGILAPTMIIPGGIIEYSTTTSFTTLPGATLLGFSTVNLDLGTFGAPGNTLHVNFLGAVPHDWTSTFIGRSTTTSIPIPADPSLIDLQVFAQPVLFDASANTAGLVPGRAIETTIGANVALPIQQVAESDAAAANGQILRFSLNRDGGAAIRLDGVFQ